MIQPPRRPTLHAFALIVGLLTVGGCGREPPAVDRRPAGTMTIASLSPALTDLVLALGAGDRLVAVSNFEPPRPQTDALPRVGDYQTVDWEQLSRLRPGLIVTQYRPDKMPEGFRRRAAGIGAGVVNVDIDTLGDVEAALRDIAAAGAVDPGPALARFRAELDDVRARVAGRPRVLALVVIGETGLTAAGPGNFVDELLALAGGENVLKAGPDYASLDRERLLELNPPTIIQLLPGASDQVKGQASAFWREKMGSLQAVREGRVRVIDAPDALLPGTNAAGLARRFAEILHP